MDRGLGRTEVYAIVLHVLLRGPSHGYAIARTVSEESASALHLGEGTLYPVLRDLETRGLVNAEWQTNDAGPARKVYRITDAGRAECAERTRLWRERVRAIGGLLGRTGLGHA
jgi:DNA-binding PadR family transcriptional regulator